MELAILIASAVGAVLLVNSALMMACLKMSSDIDDIEYGDEQYFQE